MAVAPRLPSVSVEPSVTLSSAISISTGPAGIGTIMPSPARKETSPRMRACCDMRGSFGSDGLLQPCGCGGAVSKPPLAASSNDGTLSDKQPCVLALMFHAAPQHAANPPPLD